MESKPGRIQRLCIIGVGLIGGSLARALRRAGAVDEVVGAGRNADRLARAVELGVIDRYTTDLPAAVAGADMVLVAVPLGAMEGVFAAIAPAVSQEAVVTDAGSAKGCVLDAATRAFGGTSVRFVPGHPIAGTERSGVEASFSELFEGRRVILTPVAQTEPAAIDRVRTMWERAGAVVETMSAAHHDEVLAETSHLPHILAYALVDSLARLDDSEEIFRFAAGGFRDFTRIASSDPGMWRDICLGNREALLAAVRRFAGDLEQLTQALDASDGETLKAIFARAKAARERHVD